MSLYLDASVLVAALTEEARTVEARQLISSYERSDVALSSWTLVEVLSGLSKKVRTGDLTAADFEILSRQVRAMPNSFSRTPISEEHFLAAMRLVSSLETGLRAGDALHLSIAADFNLTLATFDKGLQAAAEMVGVAVL